MLNNVTIGAPGWLVPAIAVCSVLGGVILWAYMRGNPSIGLRLLAAGLKFAAIILLAICLIQPMLRSERPRPHANLIGLLADNSKSMQISSHSERVTSLLDNDSAWQVRISQDFDVRRYAFDRTLKNEENLGAIEFQGSASSLVTALQTIATRYSDRPVAGVMLFTDGNATDRDGSRFDWSQLGFPVYPVIEDTEDSLRDIRVSQVTVSKRILRHLRLRYPQRSALSALNRERSLSR